MMSARKTIHIHGATRITDYLDQEFGSRVVLVSTYIDATWDQHVFYLDQTNFSLAVVVEDDDLAERYTDDDWDLLASSIDIAGFYFLEQEPYFDVYDLTFPLNDPRNTVGNDIGKSFIIESGTNWMRIEHTNIIENPWSPGAPSNGDAKTLFNRLLKRKSAKVLSFTEAFDRKRKQ